MNQPKNIREKTGKLFGDLWHRYDDTLFDESVKLFYQRFKANGFDLKWFQGKRCLDAGCGGGRYAIAMATLGAAEVIGCDISSEGLKDARSRAADMSNITFEEASVIDLPYPDESFDFVCCSGVLHHTADPEKGLQELARVLRPSGKIFLLLYGTGGLRWPTIMEIRPIAQSIGYALIDEALKLSDLPSNKQRTFLDDFFVPLIRFYKWDHVRSMLSRNGFKELERWEKGKLDHEESVSVQLFELKQIRNLFETALKQNSPSFQRVSVDSHQAFDVVQSAIDRLEAIEMNFAAGKIDESDRHLKVFGEGHHRVVAVKG
jgi:ubiquinone/menaquinone biosynthesis C-methylase UbiE